MKKNLQMKYGRNRGNGHWLIGNNEVDRPSSDNDWNYISLIAKNRYSSWTQPY